MIWLKKKVPGLATAVVGAFVCGEQGADVLLVERPGLWIDAVAYAGAFNGALDEACVFQLFEVLGDGRLGQPQDLHKVAIDTGISLDQMLDDSDTSRVGEGLHHARELVLLIGEYFGFGQAHVSIVSLQYYD